MIRFGTMGAVDDEDIVTDLTHLEGALDDLSWDIERGAAVAAAKVELRET